VLWAPPARKAWVSARRASAFSGLSLNIFPEHPTCATYLTLPGACMTVRRLYIYRRGDTDQCAIVRIKDHASLPLGVADEWRFWMQIGPLQAQGGRCGFNIQAAIDDIVGKGYCLFRGS